MKASFVLARRFYELSWVGRIRVAQDLGLREENDAELKEFEADRVVFERARSRGLIAELWDRIEAEHGDGKYAENPYRSPKGQEGGAMPGKLIVKLSLREAELLRSALDDPSAEALRTSAPTTAGADLAQKILRALARAVAEPIKES